MKPKIHCVRIVAFAFLLAPLVALAEDTQTLANITTGAEQAVKRGVHETVLAGDGGVANPFDTRGTVTFTPASGEATVRTMHAFHDGGNVWRARDYLSEAVGSQLRGRQLLHPKNPRWWITENGGWFLDLCDAAYFLLDACDSNGSSVSGDDALGYLRDGVARGITSVRCFLTASRTEFSAAARVWDDWYFREARNDVRSCGMGLGADYPRLNDGDRINLATKQRISGKPTFIAVPGKLNECHTLVLEIKRDEVVGTVDGGSATLNNPLFGTEKRSVMLVAATEAEKTGIKGTFHTDKLPALDAAVEQAIAEGKLLGANVWVERDGASYHKAFGQRALQPVAEPMTEDTVFDVASVTKAVAATSAAMWCVEHGLFKVDDPVSKYLPEFAGDGRENITIRHLLLHTSGLQVNLNGSRPPHCRNSGEVLAQLGREKPLFEPGSVFSYSSTGTMALGCVIERVTGRTFDELCTVEIFRPLKMTDTGFRPEGERLKRTAPSSSPVRGQVDDTVARYAGNVAAHASLFTTTTDLARFARMMLNLGELDGVRVFKPETVRLFTSVQSPPGLTSPDANNLPVRRGLGWDIDTPYRTPPHDYSLARGAVLPVGSYGHTGWTGQMLWIDPCSRTFVIFLCNRYVGGTTDTRPAVYQLHHRISTLAAEAVKGFDFENVPGALPRRQSVSAPSSFTNSLGMKFVPVPGTQILMCIHETRRADYAHFAAENTAADPAWQDANLGSRSASAGDDHPVVNVSWDNATSFCEWLSKKEGKKYRLPMDREWSIAVGLGEYEPAGGVTPESLSGKVPGVYPWGRQWPPAKGAGNYADAECRIQYPNEKIVPGYADGFAITSPVMSFPPNELGVYDLGGSVWEWCEDWFNDEKKDHVLRGASWGSSAPSALLSSYRGNQPSTRRWRCDGFRCVLERVP